MADTKLKQLPVIEPVGELNFKINNPTAIAISSPTPHQPSIYIGSVTGSLLLLSLNPSTSSLSLLKQTLVSGGSPVIGIQVVAHLGKVLLLSADGFLYVVDSLSLEPVRKVTVIKGSGVGVSAFSRRFFGQNYRFPGEINDVASSNGVKISEDGGNSNSSSCSVFAAAVGKKLVLMEMISGGSIVILKEIQGVFDGAVGILVWLDDSIIFGNMSGYYIYSCVEGQCRLIFALPESSGPPRLKYLVRECRVLLVVDNLGVVVDADGQPVSGSLVFQGLPNSVGEIGRYVAVLTKGKIDLYHKKSGICLQSVVYFGDGNWGPCVLANEEDPSGEFLAVSTNSKVLCYYKVSSEEQIKNLLRKKRFKEAILLVEELQSEGEMTKEMLSCFHAQVGFLLLFDLHFEEAVDHFLLSETMQPSELFPFIMRDPNRWSLLVPRNRYWGLHPPPMPLENVVDDGLKSIQRAIFLWKAGVETTVDNAFLLKPPSSAGLLECAIKNVIRYLEVSREKDFTTPVKEGVDTLLMYLYRALDNTDAMDKLASSNNSCIVEELESLLKDSGHLRTLAYLYASKGMNSKALDIWRHLARNDVLLSYNKDPVGNHDLRHRSDSTSGQETAVLMASKILEESSDQDLVLEHLGWIAEISQTLAVQVLISEKRTGMLSADDVISAIHPKKVEILQRYLQWLIEDQESDDCRYHTMYALLLAKSALETYEMEHSSLEPADQTLAEMNRANSISNTIFETHVRERLQNFLQLSDLYDPDRVLDLIGESELWLEKAILYRKLGQEALVLQILALKLEDCEAAERYCAEIGRADAYMQLLEMYLYPEDGKEPMFTAAVRLLHNHGEALDPLQVLERLSPDMPLQLASDTILRMLRARLHHHRQGQIVHSMSRALDVDTKLSRLEERSRHVLINDETVCDSCHARLGTKLFAMYPDDTVVCYKCFRRQGDSTSVTGRDFRLDVLYKAGWLVTR